jgi:hypothetical protein
MDGYATKVSFTDIFESSDDKVKLVVWKFYRRSERCDNFVTSCDRSMLRKL